MPRIVEHPTATAQWYTLVCEAQARTDHSLGEALESYLVFMLMRYLARPEISNRVLALDYLKGLLASGERQLERLRHVGDVCLLHAGLFPRRARRRRVGAHYYVDLGRSAYYQLAQNIWDPQAEVFQQASEGFVDMTEVLAEIRHMRDGTASESLAPVFGHPPTSMH